MKPNPSSGQVRECDATRILKRHAANPILRLDDYPGVAQIYNPAPAQLGGETILLVSVVDHAATRGYGRDVGQTRIARSQDGIHFELGKANFIDTQATGMPWDLYHHFIDNRVTAIEGEFYIITPVMVKGFDSPVGMLGKTKDFIKYERIAVITQPKNRGASLFPSKINGRYYKLDRPGGGDGGNGDIWISSSPDLIHWGNFQPLIAAGYRYWNTQKIGPTPPLWTPEGWLEIMHGVFSPAGEPTITSARSCLISKSLGKSSAARTAGSLRPKKPMSEAEIATTLCSRAALWAIGKRTRSASTMAPQTTRSASPPVRCANSWRPAKKAGERALTTPTPHGVSTLHEQDIRSVRRQAGECSA